MIVRISLAGRLVAHATPPKRLHRHGFPHHTTRCKTENSRSLPSVRRNVPKVCRKTRRRALSEMLPWTNTRVKRLRRHEISFAIHKRRFRNSLANYRHVIARSAAMKQASWLLDFWIASLRAQ
jgi:hypothetical protein